MNREDQKRSGEHLSLPGHDRDCAQAMLSQARLRTSPLDEIQVIHLLQIGFRAGKRAGREDAARAVERLRDLAMRDTTVDTDIEQVMADSYFGALDEAAVIARGDGVQPTEEQRAGDQERGDDGHE